MLLDVRRTVHEQAQAAGAVEFHPFLADGADAAMVNAPIAYEKIETVRAGQVDSSLCRFGRVLICVRGSNRTECCSQYANDENGGRYERCDKGENPLRLHDCLELTVRICEARLGIARTSWCDVTRPLLRAFSRVGGHPPRTG